MYFIFSDQFVKTSFILIILLLVTFIISYTIARLIRHREYMKELDQDYTPEQAKELLKLIKDIYN